MNEPLTIPMRLILMIKLYFIIICILSFGITKAQYSDFAFFRNYNNSLFVKISSTPPESFYYSDYGKLYRLSNSKNRYLFQSQEYESNLNLMFFPERIYSANKYRFNTPDALNQYFSPYLFVGSDPINIIDFDGNEGVPLVIYSNDYTKGSDVDYMTRDILNLKTDAHKISLNDFLDGNFGNVPKLNGNVFFIGHTGDFRTNQIVTAKYAQRPERLPAEGGVKLYSGGGKFEARMNGKRFGQLLRKFASDHGTEIKNIMTPSCKGLTAAKTIGEGFKEAPKDIAKTGEVNIYGLNTDMISATMGNVHANAIEGRMHIQPFNTEFHIVPESSRQMQIQCTYPRSESPKYETVNYFKRNSRIPLEKAVANEDELIQMINLSRLPKQFNPYFSVEKIAY